jgi:hypothetical protein
MADPFEVSGVARISGTTHPAEAATAASRKKRRRERTFMDTSRNHTPEVQPSS